MTRLVSGFEFLIEKRRLQRRAAASCYRAEPSEWKPVPLGRLGRRLFDDIERYLEFFEIAGADVPRARPRRIP